MSGTAAVFLLRGHELEVVDLDDGWLVRSGDETAQARYLDHALAELLRLPPGLVLSLVKQILEGEPGSELFL